MKNQDIGQLFAQQKKNADAQSTHSPRTRVGMKMKLDQLKRTQMGENDSASDLE